MEISLERIASSIDLLIHNRPAAAHSRLCVCVCVLRTCTHRARFSKSSLSREMFLKNPNVPLSENAILNNAICNPVAETSPFDAKFFHPFLETDVAPPLFTILELTIFTILFLLTILVLLA